MTEQLLAWAFNISVFLTIGVVIAEIFKPSASGRVVNSRNQEHNDILLGCCLWSWFICLLIYLWR